MLLGIECLVLTIKYLQTWLHALSCHLAMPQTHTFKLHLQMRESLTKVHL